MNHSSANYLRNNFVNHGRLGKLMLKSMATRLYLESRTQKTQHDIFWRASDPHLSQRQMGGEPVLHAEGKGSLHISGKKKAHKHKLFCPVGLGTTPGLSREFHRVCPWDKFGENLGQIRVFSLFYKVERPASPGLSLPQTRGRKAAQKVYVQKVYVPFSLANIDRVVRFSAFPMFYKYAG